MATKYRCSVCGREATYTEITCYHDSMQVLNVSHFCGEHVGTLREPMFGRDVFTVQQSLSRSDAQFWVYEFAEFAKRD